MLFPAEMLLGPRGREEVDRLRAKAEGCSACALAPTRKKVVFGEGNPDQPLIAFVGEAPGANEDIEGRPFVGRSGDLLNRMIERMGLKREQIYICNTVCCRPPENRRPEFVEMAACRPLFVGQLRAVLPKAIVALGLSASQALLRNNKKKNAGVGDLRGKWHEWEGVPVRVTFHPAYLLREPAQRKEAWEDLQAVATKVGLIRGE